jgi:hypothetical protein
MPTRKTQNKYPPTSSEPLTDCNYRWKTMPVSPKGLCKKAQGCRAAATLGCGCSATSSTLKGLRNAWPIDSIPNILLVERDVMFPQEFPELILKRRLPMMFFL